MNDLHLRFLSSPEWASMLEADLLPWLTASFDLGDDVLEVGPGPGLTTDLLRRLAGRLTVIEVDASLASALGDRLLGTNVEVIHGDATHTGLPADRFSAVTCFGMLHHVPSAEEQDQVFAELHRVLRPSGWLVGSDSLDDERIREAHADDVFVPMDPGSLPVRLGTARFADVHIEVREFDVRFDARKKRG